jgi:trigger factor
MSLKSSKKIDTNRYELEIEVDKPKFKEAVDKAFYKKSKSIIIPGFRKGKAPRAFIEKYYGEGVFFQDAFNDIYPEAIEEALEEADLEFVQDHIDLDIEKIGKEDGVIFKTVLTTRPHAEIKNYQNLSFKPKSTDVTSKDVDDALKEIMEKNARLVPANNRPAQQKDVVNINFKGFIDGVDFEGGIAENYDLKLGSDTFIPGFESSIVGHSKDEEFQIKLRFPKDYQARSFADKEVIFEIKINEIKEPKLPELNDDFIKDIDDKIDTVDEYKKYLTESLKKYKQMEYERDQENQLANQLINLTEVEIPDAMVESKIKEELEQFDKRLKTQKLDLNSYLEYNNIGLDDFKQNIRPNALNQVKYHLALEAIAQKEGLIPSDEQVQEEYEKIAQESKIDVKKVKELFRDRFIKRDLAVRSALAFVKKYAVAQS